MFDQQVLHTLRTYSALYFHGHSVGGTNPSLLEAMASRAIIAAHDNTFNRSIVGNDAFYFSLATDVTSSIGRGQEENQRDMTVRNLEKIRKDHNWPGIIEEYEDFMLHCVDKKLSRSAARE